MLSTQILGGIIEPELSFTTWSKISAMRAKGKKFATVCFLMVALLALWVSPKEAFSDEVKLEAEGSAQVVGGNQVAAREKALRDFEVRAVVKAVLDLVGPDQYQQNRDKIQKAIITKADRYLKAYKVSGEEPQQETYRVRGEAIILIENLKKDLAALGLKTGDIKASAPTSEAKEPGKKAESAEPSSSATTKEAAQPQDQAQPKEEKLPALLWSIDRSCDQEVEGKNAGDLFSEIFVTRLAELGFNVVSSDQEPQEKSKMIKAQGNFICLSNKISIRIELLQNYQKQEIEDYVPIDAEETPLMDALTTLSEIAANHLLQTLGYAATPEGTTHSETAESPPEASEPKEPASESEQGKPQSPEEPSSQPTPSEPEKPPALKLWQIVIKDPHGGMLWEKLQRKLKESGVKIEVSRILISPESFTIETPELSEKTIAQIDSASKDGLNLKVESVDTEARRIVIRSESSQ